MFCYHIFIVENVTVFNIFYHIKNAALEDKSQTKIKMTCVHDFVYLLSAVLSVRAITPVTAE